MRVLLPVYVDAPLAGSNGSSWTSDFRIYNASDGEYLIESCSPTEQHPCVLILRDDEKLTQGETQSGLPASYPKPDAASPGTVLYLVSDVDRTAQPGDLSFQLRVKDLSHNSLSAGTEIPVVRESLFHSATPIRLLGVRIESGFRLLLRVYDMNLDTASFAVRVFDESSGEKLNETIVTATTNRVQPLYRFQPAFAQLSNLGLTSNSSVRIEVVPLSVGSSFWAFISVTNNTSQEFTVVTPQ
jgi:hypothetical protein